MPEAVVLREELHAAVVVVESSDFLQAPMIAIIYNHGEQKNFLFHNNLFHLKGALYKC